MRQFLILTTFCLYLALSYTQTHAQNTSIGIKAAPLWSHISNQNNGESMIGLRFGGFLTHSISTEFGVGGELNFARKGGISGSDQALNLDYVEVPLLAHYFFGKGGFRPKVIAGPYFGYLLQAKRDGKVMDNYNQEDYGIMLGIGFHQRLGNKRWLYADLRYGHGLAEILPNSEQSNRDISLNIGVSFPLNLPN